MKTEINRSCLTIGGDVLDYSGDTPSPAAFLLEIKLLINSVISDFHCGSRFMSLDIGDYFLQSIMEDPEYIRIHSKYSMEDIWEKYNITPLIAPYGYVYYKIKRSRYVLN